MAGKFIPLVLAASVAVTSLTAAPARAGDKDVARVLAALAGLVVIGAVLNDAQKNRRLGLAAPVHHPRPVYSSRNSLAHYAPERSLRPKAADRHVAARQDPDPHDQDQYSARPPMDAE